MLNAGHTAGSEYSSQPHQSDVYQLLGPRRLIHSVNSNPQRADTLLRSIISCLLARSLFTHLVTLQSSSTSHSRTSSQHTSFCLERSRLRPASPSLGALSSPQSVHMQRTFQSDLQWESLNISRPTRYHTAGLCKDLVMHDSSEPAGSQRSGQLFLTLLLRCCTIQT